MKKDERIEVIIKDIKNCAIDCDLQVRVMDLKTFRKRMKLIISNCNEIFEILSPKLKI